jgi:gluconokinase
MARRKNHYMKAEMLKSQFDALEEPADALTVDISPPVEEIVQAVLKQVINSN